jgi:hypothetical protein
MAKKKLISNGQLTDKEKSQLGRRLDYSLENIECLVESNYILHVRKEHIPGEPSLFLVKPDLLDKPNGHPYAVYFAFNGSNGGLVPVNESNPYFRKLPEMIKSKEVKKYSPEDLKSFLEEKITYAISSGRGYGTYPI